jgi:hypothetical protein
MRTHVNTIFATLMALAPVAGAETIPVLQHQPNLQAIIDAAQPGDTIQLAPGTWTGPLVIPAGKDGLVLQGAATLVAGGRPCTADQRPDALLKVVAQRVTDAAGPKVGILATGRDLQLEGVTVQGIPGDALVLMAPGAQVLGCTLQAAAGAAVVLAMPGTDDTPICTWGGPKVEDVIDLFGGALGTLTGIVQAARPTQLSGNLFIDVQFGVRVLGFAEGELLLDRNEIDATGPALIIDPAPGAFTVLVRGPQPRAAWLMQDEAGNFLGDTPRTDGDVLLIADGTQGLGLTGQAAH